MGQAQQLVSDFCAGEVNPRQLHPEIPSKGTRLIVADRLLTYRDAADLARCSVSNVRRIVGERRLKVVRVGHNTPRIRPADLNAWMAGRCCR